MSTTHTAGPWKHEGDGYITGIENDPANKCVGLVDIASVYLRAVPGRHDANARLIAAAPELLEALQEMVAGDAEAIEEAQALGAPFPEEMLATFKKARAAIARATGETA